MDAIYNLIEVLKIDSTLWVQLGIFLVGYFILSKVVFKPYLKALHWRKENTVGGEENAQRIIEETAELHQKYEKAARHLNEQHKSIFDQSHTEAMKEHDQIVSQAREGANQLLEENRKKIEAEVHHIQENLDKDIPKISQSITGKILGKEL